MDNTQTVKLHGTELYVDANITIEGVPIGKLAKTTIENFDDTPTLSHQDVLKYFSLTKDHYSHVKHNNFVNEMYSGSIHHFLLYPFFLSTTHNARQVINTTCPSPLHLSKRVKDIAALPFVDDMRDKHAYTDEIKDFRDLKKPIGIIWHQTDTYPVDKIGVTLDGLRLLELRFEYKDKSGFERPPYHVIVSGEEIEINGQTYAKAQWLVEPHTMTWHTRTYNNRYLGIAYVDQIKHAPPTPAQLCTMYEISRHWMKQFKMSPKRIVGHKEVAPKRKTDPAGVDMGVVRNNLR